MSESYSGKRVLITGGAGFIGPNLTKALINEGASVSIADNLYTGRKENLHGIDCEFFEVDVTNQNDISRLIKDKDIVFHLAAVPLPYSNDDPQRTLLVNGHSIKHILDAALEYGIERVVNISSVLVFGNPKELQITEKTPITPMDYSWNPYPRAKRFSEIICRLYGKLSNANFAIVRYSNVYGPGQDLTNPQCGVIGKFMNLLSNGQPPPIHGDGSDERDYLFLGDAVKATLLAGIKKEAEQETFNLGTNVGTSTKDLAHMVINIFKSDLEPLYKEQRDIDKVDRRVVNPTKAYNLLGWKPQTTLEDGLRITKGYFDEKYPK